MVFNGSNNALDLDPKDSQNDSVNEAESTNNDNNMEENYNIESDIESDLEDEDPPALFPAALTFLTSPTAIENHIDAPWPSPADSGDETLVDSSDEDDDDDDDDDDDNSSEDFEPPPRDQAEAIVFPDLFGSQNNIFPLESESEDSSIDLRVPRRRYRRRRRSRHGTNEYSIGIGRQLLNRFRFSSLVSANQDDDATGGDFMDPGSSSESTLFEDDGYDTDEDLYGVTNNIAHNNTSEEIRDYMFGNHNYTRNFIDEQVGIQGNPELENELELYRDSGGLFRAMYARDNEREESSDDLEVTENDRIELLEPQEFADSNDSGNDAGISASDSDFHSQEATISSEDAEVAVQGNGQEQEEEQNERTTLEPNLEDLYADLTQEELLQEEQDPNNSDTGYPRLFNVDGTKYYPQLEQMVEYLTDIFRVQEEAVHGGIPGLEFHEIVGAIHTFNAFRNQHPLLSAVLWAQSEQEETKSSTRSEESNLLEYSDDGYSSSSSSDDDESNNEDLKPGNQDGDNQLDIDEFIGSLSKVSERHIAVAMIYNINRTMDLEEMGMYLFQHDADYYYFPRNFASQSPIPGKLKLVPMKCPVSLLCKEGQYMNLDIDENEDKCLNSNTQSNESQSIGDDDEEEEEEDQQVSTLTTDQFKAKLGLVSPSYPSACISDSGSNSQPPVKQRNKNIDRLISEAKRLQLAVIPDRPILRAHFQKLRIARYNAHYSRLFESLYAICHALQASHIYSLTGLAATSHDRLSALVIIQQQLENEITRDNAIKRAHYCKYMVTSGFLETTIEQERRFLIEMEEELQVLDGESQPTEKFQRSLAGQFEMMYQVHCQTLNEQRELSICHEESALDAMCVSMARMAVEDFDLVAKKYISANHETMSISNEEIRSMMIKLLARTAVHRTHKDPRKIYKMKMEKDITFEAASRPEFYLEVMKMLEMTFGQVNKNDEVIRKSQSKISKVFGHLFNREDEKIFEDNEVWEEEEEEEEEEVAFGSDFQYKPKRNVDKNGDVNKTDDDSDKCVNGISENKKIPPSTIIRFAYDVCRYLEHPLPFEDLDYQGIAQYQARRYELIMEWYRMLEVLENFELTMINNAMESEYFELLESYYQGPNDEGNETEDQD